MARLDRDELEENDCPKLAVFTHVYPSSANPNLGLFVRERMRRVAEHIPITVVAPVPWFPFQRILRFFKPGYRPIPPYVEQQDELIIYHPRYFSIPGLMRWADGFFEALCSLPLLYLLKRDKQVDIIDSHFIYPDGVAANYLSRWLKLPYTITLRGSLTRFADYRLKRTQIETAMRGAAKVFSVAGSLREDAIQWGIPATQVKVVGNGVDLQRFTPADTLECRRRLNLPANARVMVSVGGLTERKGFHRVIELMPQLLSRYPDLHFVVAGGASNEGNNEAELKSQIADLGVTSNVHLIGAVSPDELRYVYSAGDIFVLATRFEGWANVFLEALACGLPVVTTKVGGNAEVVPSDTYGILVDYGDKEALYTAILEALDKDWDRAQILRYAADNSWDTRIPILLSEFSAIQHGSNYTPGSDLSGGHLKESSEGNSNG